MAELSKGSRIISFKSRPPSLSHFPFIFIPLLLLCLKKRRRRGGYCQELLQQSMHRLQFFFTSQFSTEGPCEIWALTARRAHCERRHSLRLFFFSWEKVVMSKRKEKCGIGMRSVGPGAASQEDAGQMIWARPRKVFSVNEWVKERKKNLHFLAKQKNLNRKLEKCSCCCYCGRTVTQVL